MARKKKQPQIPDTIAKFAGAVARSIDISKKVNSEVEEDVQEKPIEEYREGLQNVLQGNTATGKPTDKYHNKNVLIRDILDGEVLDPTVLKQVAEQRKQAFLQAMTLKRLETVRGLIGKVETLEESLLSSESLERMEDADKINLYKELNRNLNKNMDVLEGVEKDSTQSQHFGNNYVITAPLSQALTQGTTEPTESAITDTLTKELKPEQRQNLRNFIAGFTGIDKLVNKEDERT